MSPVNVSASLTYTDNIIVGTATANASWAGDDNHFGSDDSETFAITKAPTTTIVTFEAGPYVYRGTAFTATAVVTGVGGLNQPVAVVYGGDCTNVTVANGCTATATYSGDANHNGSTDSESITITKANQTITVTTHAPANAMFNTSFTVAATASSGLPVAYSASGSCSNVGATFTMTSGLGTCTVHYNQAGNTNYNAAPEVTESVTAVAWTLKGFYQPVDMNNVLNTVKGGSTVPLKFEVFAGPTELIDTAIVLQPLTATQALCSGGAEDTIELTATGSTNLRYDSTGGQFIYNWKTPVKPGFCYKVTVTTQDGSKLVAYFKLK